jgi:hypothetical protein
MSGSSIAEFGPALAILLFCLFFPLLDLLMLGFDYVACSNLNDLQTQKAAEVTPADAVDGEGPVRKALCATWQQTGFGRCVKLSGPPMTDISYRNADDRERYVTVATTFVVEPFLNIPVCPGVSVLPPTHPSTR